MTRYAPQCTINLSAVFDGFGDRDAPQVFTDIIPMSVNVHLNSYKEADTWEVTFDAKSFPFSPELIRSVAVEIYLYDAEKTGPVRKEEVKPAIPALGFQANAYAVANERAKITSATEHLVTTGLADQGSIQLSADGQTITMSGRDYTSLLIDRQWDPTKSGSKGRIPVGIPLDECVQRLVDEAVNADEVGRTLTVRYEDFEVNVKTGKLAKTVTQKKVKIAPPKTGSSRSKRKKRGQVVKADSTYWDVIYKLCLSYGLIVYVKGFEVVISKPHVLEAQSQDYYRVAYGRNLESLESERKYNKEAVPQIRVRSWLDDGSTIEGRFPSDDQKGEASVDAKGKARGFVMTGVGTKKEEYKVYTFPDIQNVNVLREIARTTYYTLARGEGVIRFSTPHLRDLENRDLLKMRAGDAVQITWDAFNAEAMRDKNLSREQKIGILLAAGYSPKVANLVATQYERLDYFSQPFYVKEVALGWAFDGGLTVDVEAMNFINPERDGHVSL